MNKDEMAHGEIIIVRRGKHAGEDDHHGGVWKIAFADFMTAMMAFFLVMWLINASNEQTKKAVASYFNPIKLTDETTNSKGVKNPKYGIDDAKKKSTEDVTTIETPAKMEIKLSTQEKKFEEQALFVDPYTILAEIEGGVGKEQGDDTQFSGTEPGDGGSLNKGVSFQDPFDPNSWSEQKTADSSDIAAEIPDEEVFDAEQTSGLVGTQNGLMKAEQNDFVEIDESELQLDQNKDQQKEALAGEEGQKAESGEMVPPVQEDMEIAALDNSELPSSAQQQIEAGLDANDKSVEPVTDTEEAKLDQEAVVSEKITEAETRIREELQAALTESKLTGLDVEVVASSDGVTVVLSDNNRNGMFNIGSARPTPELVKTMAKLGEVVAGENGKVEISGHTDGRKYQSEDYDNWRLSTARAHMAYYMLVRGGMAEDRVEKIVGQADVNLKMPDDPNSAANRRIEIFLKPE
ncbi:MAG: MotB family protein [Rhizobiaceae bacterium]|nr:MotB family protein [Rhizobiaceae bacterium]